MGFNGNNNCTPTTKQAMGIRSGKQMQLICKFDVDTWNDIRSRAVTRKISVAEQIRRLVEIGLEEEDKDARVG